MTPNQLVALNFALGGAAAAKWPPRRAPAVLLPHNRLYDVNGAAPCARRDGARGDSIRQHPPRRLADSAVEEQFAKCA